MVAVPADTPEIIPVVDPAIAIAVLLLLHVPVPALLSVVAELTQTDVVPVIADGTGLIVTSVVSLQPVVNLYVTIAVPTETAATMPVPDPTVATSVLLLLHVPPAVPLLSVVDDAEHALGTPAVGNMGLTSTEAVTIQLKPPVKVIVAVPPATPDTTPVVEPIVATLLLLLLHTPPLASLRVVVPLAHNVVVPVMADGMALMVTTSVS